MNTILYYTIKFLTPFVTITQSTKDFTPFEYFIYNKKIYLINNNLLELKDKNIKKTLYSILEKLTINNDTNNTHKFEQGLKEYQESLKNYFVNNKLLGKLQNFNWIGQIPKQKPADIKHPPFNYDIINQKYKFYLPGSTIKGIFRNIVFQKHGDNEIVNCLFGPSINNKQQINTRSKLILEDIPINDTNLEIYRIIGVYKTSGEKDKKRIPNYVMGIKKNTILNGKIKIASYNNCKADIQIILNNDNLKSTIINILYSKNAYSQVRNINVPNKYENANSLIYQAGFGSTGLFKTEKRKFPKTIYVTETEQEPLGFIKITLI